MRFTLTRSAAILPKMVPRRARREVCVFEIPALEVRGSVPIFPKIGVFGPLPLVNPAGKSLFDPPFSVIFDPF